MKVRSKELCLLASVVKTNIKTNLPMMPTLHKDISSSEEPAGMANRYLPAALLVSILLHGVALSLVYRFGTESSSPLPKTKKSISLTLISPISPSTHENKSLPDTATTKKLDTKLTSSKGSSTPQARKPKQAPPLQEKQPTNIILTSPSKEKKMITGHSVIISPCTPLQRQSKIHRCSDSSNENGGENKKWQAASTSAYQGVFVEAFQNLEQRSELQKDREKIIQLISAQEANYALAVSTVEQSKIQKKEQLRISLEINRLVDKNQGIMELIGARQEWKSSSP